MDKSISFQVLGAGTGKCKIGDYEDLSYTGYCGDNSEFD